MQLNSLDIFNQAITHLFIGMGLALFNLVVRYFVPSVPQVISVLTWKNLRRALVAAYLIALVIQFVTSPFFVSALHSVYAELAWSPYQAFWNVLGVIVIDLVTMAYNGVRRGAEAGSQQLRAATSRAAEELDELGDRIGAAVTPDEREAHAARRQAQRATEEQQAAERQKRLDEKLKDY
jgi:hypothetical protein